MTARTRKMREAKKNNKMQLDEYKKTKYCILCGASGTNCNLELHRVEDVIKVHDAVRSFLKWEKVMDIIKCCIPLCHDCHKYIDSGEV